MSRRSLSLLVALGLSALATACGTYTKRDFVASANAICASSVRQVRVVPPPVSAQLSDLAAYLARVLPIVKSEDRQIHALQRPTQDARGRAALGAYLAALSRFTSNFAGFAAAAKTGDRQAVTSAENALRLSPLDSLASGYGLRSCGAPGATVA